MVITDFEHPKMLVIIKLKSRNHRFRLFNKNSYRVGELVRTPFKIC
jgi:hypothetical protein